MTIHEERLEKIKQKYPGEEARRYEEWRNTSEHWQREQRVVSALLDEAAIGSGSEVLDVPVGTGRFFPFYKERGYRTLGIDASADMLAEARKKAEELKYDDVRLREGDITDLSIRDDRVRMSVCIRLVNWFDFAGFRQALGELRRVSSSYVLLGVRLSTDRSRVALGAGLAKALQAWTLEVKAACREAVRSLESALRPGHSLAGPSEEAGATASESSPPLIDHPEEDVRAEFRRQNLVVADERLPLTFTSDPRLSNFFVVEELPYRIFLLRVLD
jgi:ubiquinone/menaquinone biosynthesis C-methylase UbiE